MAGGNGYLPMGGKPQTKTMTAKPFNTVGGTRSESVSKASSGGQMAGFGTPFLTGTSMRKPKTAAGYKPC